MRRRFHHRTKHWEESWKYDAQRGIFDELRVVSCLIYLIHETLRRELKIRRAAGSFWRTSSCFMLDIFNTWNTEKRVENTTRCGVFLTNFELFHAWYITWNIEKRVENTTRCGVFLTNFELFHAWYITWNTEKRVENTTRSGVFLREVLFFGISLGTFWCFV